MSGLVLIRADGNPSIGAGHIMRCSAIADEVQKLGSAVLFLVSDEVSERLVRAQGFDAAILEGDSGRLAASDGEKLASFALECNAHTILIDSYAVTDSFFASMSEALDESGIWTIYMDDAYTFERGIVYDPVRWAVDKVISYTFGFSERDYEAVYGDADRCAVGPRFAPVRSEFSGVPRSESSGVVRALITTGSTNPNHSLERLADILIEHDPDIHLDVVVGRQAVYKGPEGDNISIRHDVKDMASLMRSATFAITAAGSTLYELCATGTPSIALPMFENQIRNVNGFLNLNLGLGMRNMDWNSSDILPLIDVLKVDAGRRRAISQMAQSAVDGRGALRIAQVLCDGM